MGFSLLQLFNQSVLSQNPVSPNKPVRDDTENITADDLQKTTKNLFQSDLGIKSLLEPSVITTINFDDLVFYDTNSITIQPNRYAGVSFYAQNTQTWLTWYFRYSPRNSLLVGYLPYPYTTVVSVDNLIIEFVEPAKDVAFFWGQQGYYSSGTIQIIDINNQLVATVPVSFGFYSWVNISLNQFSQRIKKLILRRPPVSDARYGHIFIDNFQFQPNPFVSPVGALTNVSTTAPVGAVGWSVDPDNASANNNVDCYVDGLAGQGRFIGRVLANNPSSGIPYPGNHNFFTPIPTDLRDGNQHQMYCYGIDVSGGNPQTLLPGSPKAFTWNPDSTVEFSTLSPVIEKEGEDTLNVTVRGLVNPNDTTRLTFRTTNGTGSAKFIKAPYNQLVDEIIITGNVVNQAVRIKGITESSQANNLIIEARFGSSTTVKATRIFTVATITMLVFEEFAAGYTPLDNNPGNGQINSNIGRRIFPDKESSTDNTDRSLVKVKATISPAIPNVRVYFANFDMDDPSASGAPIDPNDISRPFGNDNNGSVIIGTTTSTAGQLSIIGSPTGCSATVGKADCITGADGTLTVQFKTTMQPGDNFAIAASLSDTYRNGFQVYGVDIIEGSRSFF